MEAFFFLNFNHLYYDFKGPYYTYKGKYIDNGIKLSSFFFKDIFKIPQNKIIYIYFINCRYKSRQQSVYLAPVSYLNEGSIGLSRVIENNYSFLIKESPN